jgi:hypothetical protein
MNENKNEKLNDVLILQLSFSILTIVFFLTPWYYFSLLFIISFYLGFPEWKGSLDDVQPLIIFEDPHISKQNTLYSVKNKI